MYTPYQEFISQNPDVKQYGQKREWEGKIAGKIEYAQESILKILNFRFSNDALIELAKQALGSIHDIEVLGQLESEALRSPDEQYIQKQLSKYFPQNESEAE